MEQKIEFSKAELLDIHEAIHNKRRRVVEVRGEKIKITKHLELREVKYKKMVFTQFCENNTNFATPNTTLAINKLAPIYFWKVIQGDNIYKNKAEFYGKVQE